MKNIKLLIHSGSGNRGCEAIIRGCNELFGNDFNLIVYSASINQDTDVNLQNVIELRDGCTHYNKVRNSIKYVENYLSYKYGNGKIQVKNIYNKMIKDINYNDITMVVGGDVYCYGKPYVYYRFNDLLKSKYKILYGCSIEPDSIDQEMKKDLNKYNLIIARESITYEALIKNGIMHTYLFPDPAFAMKPLEVDLDEFTKSDQIIGINLSPLISNLGKNSTIVFNSYLNMIKYIIRNTDYKIMLIPHVIWETSNDYLILERLYNELDNKDRIKLVSGKYSAEQLKYIIGKCTLFVGARTHATIAAYSQCIPTLVIGYSVKARGIARDIFGVVENYVFPVQKIVNDKDLIDPLKYLLENKKRIKSHLEKKIPKYIISAKGANDILKKELKNY